jgi:Flp pilus assembly protein TadB
MNFSFLLNLSLIAVAFCAAASLWYGFIVSRRSARMVEVLARSRQGGGATGSRSHGFASTGDASPLDFNMIKQAARRQQKLAKKVYWTEQFFRAGYFRKSEREKFHLFRLVTLITTAVIFFGVGTLISFTYAMIAGGFGLLLGWRLPMSYLERVIKKRDYEILYYLPLEVEQLVIGVSSSLDIGPCVQGLVAMADERDCHNPVTELFRYVQHYVKAGASLEESLTEVGRLSCHTELKHTFMALSQVARHGGEITRQLQQLADSVSQQRETKVDAKIKQLELEATGPVALVFLAFMGILLVGLGAQVALVFQQ